MVMDSYQDRFIYLIEARLTSGVATAFQVNELFMPE